MRRLSCSALLALALVLTAAASATWASPARADSPGAGADAQIVLPYSPVYSVTVPPPRFSSNANQAMAAAEDTPTMQALHRRLHPLQVDPFILSGRGWAIDFSYGPRIVAEALLTPAGRITHVYTGPQAAAGYTRGHYAPVFDSPWVVVPFSLLFLVPFLDRRRLWRLVHLDALVLLSFLLSYWLFDHGHVEAAVWLAYPPLLYLLARMLALGFGRGGHGRSLAGALPLKALGGGLLALVVARTTLSLLDAKVVDVGYASVLGAYRIAHGAPLYYVSLAHPDTYGPIAYLAYLPFELIFPWRHAWNYLPAAHAAALVFDLVTIAGLVALGRRLRPGTAGVRLGLILAWAWSACPFTLMGLMEHSNDGLVAMLLVLALLAFSSPVLRGAWLGLAAAAKFSPAALLPLFAGGRRRSWREAAVCTAAFAFVVACSIALYLPPGGITEFYDHTLGFQLHRIDVFSPWALHPGLTPVQTVLEVAALALIVGLAVLPRRRTMPRVAAMAGAATIAVQLPAIHWFYYYIIWFVPFLLVAVLVPEGDTDPARGGPWLEPEASERPLAAGGPEVAPADPAPILAEV